MSLQRLMVSIENDIKFYIEDLLNEQAAQYDTKIAVLKNENNDLLKKIQLLENQLKGTNLLMEYTASSD